MECILRSTLGDAKTQSEGYSSDRDLGWPCFHSFLGHTDVRPRDSFEICRRSQHMLERKEIPHPFALSRGEETLFRIV